MHARPSVEDLRLIFETVSDQILLLEVDGPGRLRISSMNPSSRELVRSMGDLIGRPLEDLAAPDTEFFQACARAAADMHPIQYVQHAQLAGRTLAIDVRVMPVLRDGICTHVLSLGRDISHEHAIWRALQSSERGLDATLQAIADAVIVVDTNNHIVRLNIAAAQLVGAHVPNVLGSLFDDVFELWAHGPHERLRCADLIAVHCSREVRLGQARERAFTATSSPLRNVDDTVFGAVITLHDVTAERRAAAERRRAEEELRVSEARYQTQFEHAPEGTVTVDADTGRFIEANDVALRMFGCDRDTLFELGPVALSPLHQPDGRTSYDAALGNISRAMGGEKPVFEWVHRTHAGVDFPCEVRLVRLPGRGNLCRASIIDITERKQAEALRLLSSSLLEQNQLFQASNRMKSEFVANMSHELRTPLNAILGFAELLCDHKVGSVSAEQRECLESILVSGRHLLGLINGMLDLAKVESGRIDFVPQDVDLAGVVVEATEAVRSLASRKQLHLSTEIEENLGAGFLDPARLKQVLFNLLSNAIKFTNDGGRVLMRARTLDKTKLLLEVEDSGIGIRDADLPRLFVEFSQLESGLDKRYEGTGLGLVLTQRIVQAMGGEVSVRSRFGHGSVFGIVVPRVQPTSPSPNVETKPRNQPEARRSDGAHG